MTGSQGSEWPFALGPIVSSVGSLSLVDSYNSKESKYSMCIARPQRMEVTIYRSSTTRVHRRQFACQSDEGGVFTEIYHTFLAPDAMNYGLNHNNANKAS